MLDGPHHEALHNIGGLMQERKCTCYDGLPEITLKLDMEQAQYVTLSLQALSLAIQCKLVGEIIGYVPPLVAKHFRAVLLAYLKFFHAEHMAKIAELGSSGQVSEADALLGEMMTDLQFMGTPMFHELSGHFVKAMSGRPYCETCRSLGAPEKRPNLDESLIHVMLASPNESEAYDKRTEEMTKRFLELNPDYREPTDTE